MENNKINSVQIPYLVRLTADLFREMDRGVKGIGTSRYTPQHMHFVADLLKDLVDTAYPEEEETMTANGPSETEKEMMKELDKEFEKLAEIARHIVPPTLYPEAFKDGDTE